MYVYMCKLRTFKNPIILFSSQLPKCKIFKRMGHTLVLDLRKKSGSDSLSDLNGYQCNDSLGKTRFPFFFFNLFTFKVHAVYYCYVENGNAG